MKSTTHICKDCGGPVPGMAHRCDKCRRAHNLEMARISAAAYKKAHPDRCAESHRKYMYEKRAKEREQRIEGGARGFAKDPWLGRNYVITRDPRPVEDGGFRPGAQFSVKDLQFMLSTKEVLLDGTRWRDGRMPDQH